jgi:hypothetical protein
MDKQNPVKKGGLPMQLQAMKKKLGKKGKEVKHPAPAKK